jgi:hypothetical protein
MWTIGLLEVPREGHLTLELCLLGVCSVQSARLVRGPTYKKCPVWVVEQIGIRGEEGGWREVTYKVFELASRLFDNTILTAEGDGKRTHGVGPQSQGSGSLSRSICVGPRVSASGEVVEVVNKKDVKVDNLGESGDESEGCEDNPPGK